MPGFLVSIEAGLVMNSKPDYNLVCLPEKRVGFCSRKGWAGVKPIVVLVLEFCQFQ
jgi:hypothetical protein